MPRALDVELPLVDDAGRRDGLRLLAEGVLDDLDGDRPSDDDEPRGRGHGYRHPPHGGVRGPAGGPYGQGHHRDGQENQEQGRQQHAAVHEVTADAGDVQQHHQGHDEERDRDDRGGADPPPQAEQPAALVVVTLS